MTKIQLRWVQAIRDRKGRPRYYFRRPGFPRSTLPGLPGSAEFMAAYQAALVGDALKREIGSERTKAGSISALIVAYYASAEFKALRDSTKVGYRNHLDRFRAKYGDKPVALMEPHHIRTILDGMAETPGAANNLRKRLQTLMQFAVDRNWRKDNPLLAVRRPRRKKTEGFIAWSEDEIASYEAKWPSGTRERLALALLLYTGQRRSDVVTMGRQHVRDGRIRVVQVKTDARLAIRIHPTLQAELDQIDSADERLTFLLTAFGKPFSAAGFTAWLVKAAEAAGLKDRSPHGLRKAAARRLAEAGCTAHQVAAITGHKTLSEVAEYTASVEQERLADQAMRKLEQGRAQDQK
jgi:integrase